MFDENDLKDSYLTITVRRVDVRGREAVVYYVRLDDFDFRVPSKKPSYFGRRVSKILYTQLQVYFKPVNPSIGSDEDVPKSFSGVESRQYGVVPRFLLSVLNLV